MRELCELLQLPDPGKAEKAHNAYVYERFIAPQRADSTTEKRYIDLYRRDCFVLEGKQTGKTLATQSDSICLFGMAITLHRELSCYQGKRSGNLTLPVDRFLDGKVKCRHMQNG